MDYLEKLTQQSIHENIVKFVYRNGQVSFGDIKNNFKGVNSNTINRELDKLLNKTKPPILLKSEDTKKKYSINKDHPDLEKILALLRIMPTNLELYHMYSEESETTPQLGFDVTIITKKTEGYDQDIKDILKNSDVAEAIEYIYFKLWQSKIKRDMKNIRKEKGNEDKEFEDYEAEELFDTTFDVYITSTTRGL